MRIYGFLILLILLITGSCRVKAPVDYKFGFYHWKSIPQNQSNQVNYLNELKVKNLHYRFFDLALEGDQIMPVGEAIPDTTLLKDRTFASCIFITNECFIKLSQSETDELIDKLLFKLTDRIKKLNLESQWNEIQIDCDWSQKTRQAYFYFLEELKRKMPKNLRLSATIRLHQVKYPDKTGIPPVDKGALMCYNMGDIKDITEENSIFNSTILQNYLPKNISYPVELDIALPLFEWYLVYRDGQLHKIINDRILEEFEPEIQENYITLDDDQYLGGHYLYKGDVVKKEAVSFKELEEALKIINDTRLKTSKYLLFYHLNDEIIKKFPHASLEKLIQ
jgi:hypothetical protein